MEGVEPDPGRTLWRHGNFLLLWAGRPSAREEPLRGVRDISELKVDRAPEGEVPGQGGGELADSAGTTLGH